MPGLLITEGSPKNDAAKSENYRFARYNLDSLPLSQNWQCSLSAKALGLCVPNLCSTLKGGVPETGSFKIPVK